jgi:hypothetical protein
MRRQVLRRFRVIRRSTGRAGAWPTVIEAEGRTLDTEATIASVETKQTRNDNTRWVVRDDSGVEYTTFRPAIGRAAEAAQGKRARISFHEEERNGFRNVYLDAVAPLREPPSDSASNADFDPDEAAWRTAVDAAPYLLGDEAREGEIAPEEAFEKLKPFKDLVSEDIRSGPGDGESQPR